MELLGGIERRDIVIVAYDAGWPRRFEEERDRIVAALGLRAVTVDHIGSTSVPGLAAKPIVDIDLTVAEVDDEAGYLPDFCPQATSCGCASRATGWCGRR